MTLPDHAIASNLYGRYCVPRASMERPAARTVLNGGVWEERLIALMRANCGAGDVVHAGTYFGDFLPGVASALATGARLWAFEPGRENHACAARTIALNGLSNVTLMHAGLSAEAGTATLRTATAKGRGLGGSSSIVAGARKDHRHESVPLVALDDVVPADRNVTILQLDVEEHEQKALRGALKTLTRCKPLLVLETLPKRPGFLARHVLSLGYREIGAVHGNTVLTAADDEPAGWESYRNRPLA